MQGGKEVGQPVFDPEQPGCQPPGQEIGPPQREPQYQRQRQKHQWYPHQTTGEQPVPVPQRSACQPLSYAVGQILPLPHQAGYQTLRQKRPFQPRRRQQLFPFSYPLDYRFFLPYVPAKPFFQFFPRSVPLQKPHRQPAGRYPRRFFRQYLHYFLDGRLYGREIFDLGRSGLLPQHLIHRLQQLRETLSMSGVGAHHRHPQPAGQLLHIHGDAPPSGFVHQVDAYHRPGLEFHDLKGQTQPPLQTGGVAHRHRRVAPAKEQKIPGHFLFRRAGHQRVGPRQVGDRPVPSPHGTPSAGCGHRFAGPVPRVLAQPGQTIE